MPATIRDYLVEQAREITTKAERESRRLTADETAQIEDYLAKVKGIDEADTWVGGELVDAPESVKERARMQANNAAMAAEIASFTGGGGGGLANAVLQAGFSLASHPSVTISSALAIGAKAVTDSIGPDAWSVIRPDAVVPYGRDTRFLWQLLPTRNSDGNSAVADFVQTARSVSGTVQRAIDATSDKAELGVTVDVTVEQLVQWAVTIDAIPNALLEDISTLRTFLDSEMRYQIGLATDRHVVAKIVAANPAFTSVGSDVISTARNAIADMRGLGASPSLLVLDPADAAALDLAEQPGSGGDYVFATRDTGSSSPLWGLRVVESPAMAGHNALLVDPAMLGTLFLGNTRIDADPFGANFKKNLTCLRCEVSGLMHIRNKQGAMFLEAVS